MVQSYYNIIWVNALNLRNDRKIISLVVVFFIALFVRLLPVMSTSLPYNYGSWVFIQQIRYAMQQGPIRLLFDFFKINGNIVFSSMLRDNITIISYVAPLLCSLIIYPVYFLTRNLTGDHSASVFAALLAAVSGTFANQTNHLSSESIALLISAFIIFLSYDAIAKNNSKKLVLLLLSCLLLSFFDQLVSFLILCAFGIILIIDMLSELKLRIHVFSPFIFMITIQFFKILFDPGSMHLKFSIVGGSLAVLLCFFIMIFVFKYRTNPKFTLRRVIMWSGSATIIIAFLITLYAARLAPLYQLNYVLISLSFHLIPYSIILVFPGLIGGYLHLSKTENVVNRLFTIIWCVTPLIVGFMMFVPDLPILGFKLGNYLLLGSFPLMGIGLSTLISLGEKKWKPVKGFVTSYFLLALTILSFPLAIQMFNHNQFYYLPEVNAANWASTHIPTPVIDSDYRIGVLLRCFIEDSQLRLGDESSWLGEVNKSEIIHPLEDTIEYVVITESMLIHGFVRQGFWLPIPLQTEVVEYLDNSPKIDRIYSNGEVTIYKMSD